MGTVDIYHSRRTNYRECLYWIRDERTQIGNSSEWILKNKPSGKFYAKEVSPKYGSFNQLGNGFAFRKDGITLESDDDLDEIIEGCLVMYNGKAWFVDNIQSEVHRKESEFSSHTHYKYTITLRR